MILFRKKHAIDVQKIIVESSILFDKSYYLCHFSSSIDLDPASHFCKFGWLKGLNPSRHFDTNFYLKNYPDVAARGLNPLVHYLLYGAKEFRAPSPNFDVQEFMAAHREYEGGNPAEACLTRYGTYAWTEKQKTSALLPDDVTRSFLPYFDEKFYASFNKDVAETTGELYKHFIEFGQYEFRDPNPNFDIYLYKQKIDKNTGLFSNPVFHFVKFGKLNHISTLSENSTVLSFFESGGKLEIKEKLCVHAHCFYPELIWELMPRFASFPRGTKFVLTTVCDSDRQFIESILEQEDFAYMKDVRVVPNKGRDLGPLIVGCKDLWWESDIILHVHTKKSPHVKWGDEWRRYLFDLTMGSRVLVESVLRRFALEADLGCLFPRNYYLIRPYVFKENNKDCIENILNQIGASISNISKSEYPAGSMAWYRTKPLRLLVEKFGSLDYFEDEAHQVDNTFAHALERALPLATLAAGYRVVDYVAPYQISPAPLKGLQDHPARCSVLACGVTDRA